MLMAYLTHNFGDLILVYVCAAIHEGAHLLTCRALKIKTLGIRLMPWGLNLNTEFIRDPVKSVIISASGPALSLILALVFTTHALSVVNMVIFVLNMCPALPFDGGAIAEGLISHRLGYIKAHRYMISVTRTISVIFAVFGIIFAIMSKYNISLLVISGFLMYNLRIEYKRFIFLREMIFTDSFAKADEGARIKHFALFGGVAAMGVTDDFGYSFVCHFSVYDENMNLLGHLTQSDIIEGIIRYGSGVTVGEICGGRNER